MWLRRLRFFLPCLHGGGEVEKKIFTLIDEGKIDNFRSLEKIIIKEYVEWVKKHAK